MALDLTIIALIAVVALVASAGAGLIILRRRKKRNKTKNLIASFIEQKAQNRAKTNIELARLEKLCEKGEIDKETCERLKSVLVDVKGKKENEVDVFKYVISKKKKKADA